MRICVCISDFYILMRRYDARIQRLKERAEGRVIFFFSEIVINNELQSWGKKSTMAKKCGKFS